MATCVPLSGSSYISVLRAVSCYLGVSTTGMLVYPDGCLTTGYPIRLGAITGVTGVLTSALDADDEDSKDACFVDAGHASLHVRLPAVAELVPVCSYQ